MDTAISDSADQTAVVLEKMTLKPQNKASDISVDVKKPSDKNFGHKYDKDDLAIGQVPKYERSTAPMKPYYIDQSMCYVNSYPYFYGAYDGTPQDWAYYQPYAPYSPATSPSPTINAQPYSPQQYHYPTSYPSMTTNGAPFTPSAAITDQRDAKVVKDQKQKPLSSETIDGGDLEVNSGLVPPKSLYSNPAFSSKGSLGNGQGTLPGGLSASCYQDTRFHFDASRYPSWTDGRATPVNSLNASDNSAYWNQNTRPQDHLMSRPITGNGASNGFMNRIFTNPVQSGYRYSSNGYDSRINGRGWHPMEAKYRPRGRGIGFYRYGNENADGLNELTRGPRATVRNFETSAIASVVKDQDVPASAITTEEKDKLSGSSVAEDYNLTDFPVEYADAKFFIIKSYSEDDMHKSVKYNVWASTPNGNKKLDAAYKQAQEKSTPCPVFLFFSVNASGQFVGLAEMVGSVDFDKNLEYWQQDKWNGCFSLKWHIVKDVPNTLLKHIILENNENKPVTNSRDTQEVKLEQGLQILKIFKDHSCRTSILDDFEFYEARQKNIQEKKVRMQFQKQVWEGRAADVNSQDGKPNPLEAISIPVVY